MKTVLLLEDEVLLLNMMRQILKQYIVLEATSAERALSHFAENAQTVGLLIADVSLPTGSGIQVAQTLRSQVPDLPVILTSGYPVGTWKPADSAALARLGADSVTIIQKPFRTQVLINAVEGLIGSPRSGTVRTAGC